MHPNTAKVPPGTVYSFLERCCLACLSLGIIFATGMIQECLSAKRTHPLFLYPSLLCLAAFCAMWGYAATCKTPYDPLWYRHHRSFMLVAAFLLLVGFFLLFVAIYPIYHMWGCAIVFLWVVFIATTNGAVTYIQRRLPKKGKTF